MNVCVTVLASSPNPSDAHEMKSDEFKAAMKESPRRYTNPFLSDEENDKLNFWNNPELEHPIVKDDFTTNLEDQSFKKSLAHSNDIPSESFEKAKEYYVDKNVTECNEESGFHVVKDICVDEGLLHDEKVLINGDNHGLSFNPVLINGDKHEYVINGDKPTNDDSNIGDNHDDVIGGNLDGQFLKHESMRPSSYTNELKNVSEDGNGLSNFAPDEMKLIIESNIAQTGEAKVDLGSNSLNNSSMEQLVSCNQDQELTSVKILESNNGVNDIDQNPNEEILNIPHAQNANISNEIKPPTINDPKHADELPSETQSASDNATMVNHLQRGEGESSFTMAGPVSGLITYSGPIPSSGSISLRSDSSTTSVRSFAFPVLQTEWNSSPIRMAKADGRRSQKHRGWKKAFLCCEF